MKKKIILFAFIISAQFHFSQGQNEILEGSGVTEEHVKQSIKWIDNLYERTVRHEGDSIIFNAEAKELLNNQDYRNLIYPSDYTWEKARDLLNAKALKPAFWHLINLYPKSPENKELVLQMLVQFDDILDMDRVLVSTYYSYVAFDPEISIIENGITQKIIHPEIAEQKLLHTEEIVKSVLFYRDQKSNAQKN